MDVATVGFGMMPLSEALAEALTKVQPQAQVQPPSEASSHAEKQQSEQVSGQKLAEQAKSEPVETDYRIIYWLFAIFTLGLLSYFARPTKKQVWQRPIIEMEKVKLNKAA